MESGLKFTKYLGISFLIIGLLRLLNFFPTSPIYLFCISLSALLLIMTDLIDLYDTEAKKVPESKKQNIIGIINSSLFFLAILSFTALPLILSGLDIIIYPSTVDAFTLLGLGAAIFIIGKRSENMANTILKGDLMKMFDTIRTETKTDHYKPENQKILREIVRTELLKIEEQKNK